MNTRERIAGIEKRIEELEECIAEMEFYGDDSTDYQIELHELEEQLNFAWRDDEEECEIHHQIYEDRISEGYDDFEAMEYADKVCNW